jgi:TPR repeat protein
MSGIPLIEYKCAAAVCARAAPFRCVLCLGAHYCSKDCQQEAWAEHKAQYKRAAIYRQELRVDTPQEVDATIGICYRKAHANDKPDPGALHRLSLCYYFGMGVMKDRQEALRLTTRSARYGYVRAQHNLGTFYSAGEDIALSHEEAAYWYAQAAEQGCPESMCNMGLVFFNGHGVPTNLNESFKWYKRSADAGFAKAQANVATFYAQGLGGCEVDIEQSRMYRQRAELGGFSPPKETMDILNEHALAAEDLD